MERTFSEYLKRSLKSWIKVNAPRVKLSKLRLGFRFEGSVIWQADASDGKKAYLILQFESNRDYVQLHLAWEKGGMEPDPELIHNTYENFKAFEKDGLADPLAAVIARSERGWASGNMVNATLWYEMSELLPPEERLRELFEGEATRKKAAEALLEPVYSDWRKAKLYHSWNWVSHFLTLTEEDCDFALKGTLDALTNAIRTAYLPRIGLVLDAPE